MKFIDGFCASVLFFTRLPLRKVGDSLDEKSFGSVTVYWSYIGWITATLWIVVYYLGALVLNPLIAATIAYAALLFFTGGLHEDGLADFFDAFGVRHSAERSLEIMKDSHIGTFGVLSLIFYYISVISFISSVSVGFGMAIILTGAPWSRFCSGQLVNFLPYARKEGAKNHVTYNRNTVGEFVISLIGGILPLMVVVFMNSVNILPLIAGSIASCFVVTIMIHFLKSRIDGYTGDCCGATVLLSELAFIMTSVIVYDIIGG